MLAWLTRSRATERFGERVYPNCAAHAEAAEAVQKAVEQLTKVSYPDLPLDEAVAGVLDYPGSGPYPGVDSLAAAERLMALEEEYGEIPVAALDDATATEVLAVLLGPAIQTTSWSPQTVWVRSIRAIINARAGVTGRCTCIEEADAQPAVRADKQRL